MFSPAKAITAAAIVFGIGGVMLIAQPFGQQGGTLPGAATEGTRLAPVRFTGHIECGPLLREGTSDGGTLPGGEGSVTRGRGGRAHRQTATMSDPRLEGDHVYSVNGDDYYLPGPDGDMEQVSVERATRRIVNDEGAWQGAMVAFVAPDEISPGRIIGTTKHVDTFLLIGEGGYEGLTAVFDSVWDGGCGFDVTGIILEGDLPPAESFVGE